MSDELNDLLRRAMTTLEDQVPPGYFEAFPDQLLARLADVAQDAPEDALGAASSADQLPAAASAASAAVAAAMAEPASTGAPSMVEATPAPMVRDEDSGLHDIRNLASSQRMRLSKRASQTSIHADDDLLASASGSWRAVALPEPAKMVALPELADLPPASDVKGTTAAKAEAKAEAKAAKAAKGSKESAKAAKEAAKEAAKDAARPGEAASAVEQPGKVTPITAAKSKPKASGKRNALLAAAGLGLAAAAGVAFFVSTQRNETEESARRAAPRAAEDQAMQLPELRRVETRPAAIAEPEPVAAGSAAAAPAPAPAEPAERAKAVEPAPEKPTKSIGKYVPNVEDSPAPDPSPKKKGDVKKPDPGDPDFDKLLKEAGYQEKKADEPKLEKKSLSGDDIKKVMNAVTPKVTSCYAGQQGTAVVKLTVAPTGQVQKMTVSGVFAGTPTGACVEGAIQSVTFPPWDGVPQTVNFSYLLAE
ncbi:MAG TPA: hypothetical protein VNO30_05370 [Kofleriaceae bacterium]|nr:hypothetical protein [Kofleriaceae bacterium]